MSYAPNIRERAMSVSAEYKALIGRMARVSDEFLERLGESGIEAAHGLIDSRSILCDELVRCGELLKPLVTEIERSAPGMDAELSGVLADIRAGLTSLNEKQKACEAALTARMDECRTELSTLRRHDDLRGAYQQNSREQNARFLDSIR